MIAVGTELLIFAGLVVLFCVADGARRNNRPTGVGHRERLERREAAGRADQEAWEAQTNRQTLPPHRGRYDPGVRRFFP